MFAGSSRRSRVVSPINTPLLRDALPVRRPPFLVRPLIPPFCRPPSHAPTLRQQRQHSRPPLLPQRSPRPQLLLQQYPLSLKRRRKLRPRQTQSLPLPHPLQNRLNPPSRRPSLRLPRSLHARPQNRMMLRPTSNTTCSTRSRLSRLQRSFACRNARGQSRGRTRR